MPTQKKTTIGGQAIIEGSVMKGPKKVCTVVRKASGELVTKEEDAHQPSAVWKLPVLRGAYGLFMAMKDGIQAINYSASFFEDEEPDVPPSKFEVWLENKFGSEGLDKFVLGLSTVIGIALPVGLFLLLPSFLGGFVPESWGVLARNVLEGIVRVILFLVFMWSVSHMKDIRRTFEYHGAEHKTIFCYEAGEELTVENVRRQKKVPSPLRHELHVCAHHHCDDRVLHRILDHRYYKPLPAHAGAPDPAAAGRGHQL